MKRRAYIVSAILLVLFASVWGFVRAQSRKTDYAGRSLISWLEICARIPPAIGRLTDDPRPRDKHAEAIRAVQHIGTNALPTLLQWVKGEDPPWKSKLITYLAAHPQIPYRIYSAQDKFIFAADAFQYLGSNAAPALPDLMDFFKKGDSDERFRVAVVVAVMGSSARTVEPILINYLRSHQQDPSSASSINAAIYDLILTAVKRMDTNFAETENGK